MNIVFSPEGDRKKMILHYILLLLEGPIIFWFLAVFYSFPFYISSYNPRPLILQFLSIYFLITGLVVGLTAKINIIKKAALLSSIHFFGFIILSLFFGPKVAPDQLLFNLTFKEILIFLLFIGFFFIGNLVAFAFYHFRSKTVFSFDILSASPILQNKSQDFKKYSSYTILLLIPLIIIIYFFRVGVVLNVKIEPVKTTYAFNDEVQVSMTLRNFSPFPYSYSSNCGEFILENKSILPMPRRCFPEVTYSVLRPFEKKFESLNILLIPESDIYNFNISNASRKMPATIGDNIIMIDWLKEKSIHIVISE